MLGVPFEHCDVCKKDHIMPGPICTIACRDPCGSRLPKSGTLSTAPNNSKDSENGGHDDKEDDFNDNKDEGDDDEIDRGRRMARGNQVSKYVK